ncbi:MAG: cysteine desulfurase family protein, partial [Bacteroidota bacterium]
MVKNHEEAQRNFTKEKHQEKMKILCVLREKTLVYFVVKLNSGTMEKQIYLDYNATTPIDPEVVEEMLPFIYDSFGNPSSSYAIGRRNKDAVMKARLQVAHLINARPDEIIFTSGGTESNNHALRGIAFANRDRGKHIITSSIEHPAITEVCRYLESFGYEITYLPVDTAGLVN